MGKEKMKPKYLAIMAIIGGIALIAGIVYSDSPLTIFPLAYLPGAWAIIWGAWRFRREVRN